VRELRESIHQDKVVRTADMVTANDAGIFTPHSVLINFDRAIKQTTKRLPVESWSSEMRAAWVEQLAPIVAFYNSIR